MDMRGFQQYKEQSVNTMTQGELLLLLYDELVKRITRAELALNKQDYPTLDASPLPGYLALSGRHLGYAVPHQRQSEPALRLLLL